MKDVRSLVQEVADSRRPLGERHEAFGELVARFQDMAFGCAYAVLGDFYLAEDAAQEAFIVAWQSLRQLRTPEAFPGWLRRIVLTRCNRLTRGKRLRFVPLELGANAPSAAPDPHSAAEQRELRGKVLEAIKALPEHERLVTTLFYIDGYTQADIGEFLQVPLTTVTKRLHSARRRLRESAAVEMFKDDLRRRRPSRDETFADKVKARLRPFGEDDWASVSAIAPAASEGDPAGGELWLRQRREFDEARYVRRHHVAEHEETRQLLGYGSVEQSIYLPRYRLILVVNPLWLRRGVGDLLLDRLTDDLREAGAVTVTFRDRESTSEVQAFLVERGFAETTRQMDLRLAVADTNLAAFAPVVERVKARGISISTLLEERERDPRYVEKLYALTSALRLDDPARPPFAPPSYHEREARLWLELPYVLADAYFIAKDGDEYVGVTDLNLLEAVPGGVSQGFTGVRAEYRRRGIATALKVCAVEYAARRGFGTVRALNQPAHSSLLALNARLGFRHLFSHVTLERCLKEVVRVEPRVYDEYAGQYRDDERRPDLLFVVKQEGGRLTLECIGQKVELFPESETTFFAKPFYGEFTFVRDGGGQVTRLDSRVRGLDQPETVLRAKKMS
ncbi:MAG TPA: GNAT family N-acetyltransferase [Pyrinomonadaceae bacterium]|nr:GNAT family N-acetyltransferase [Pyrinomonadaceae bacterium]